MVTVLVKTDGDPLQGFVVLLAGVSLFTVVMWQYLAGQRSNFWSEEAKRLWRFVGRFFGGLIGFATLLNILVFHLVQRGR